MTKTVVILGAGWAGLPLAHKLLKYTVPKVKEGLKVILVSPDDHFFWNVAATRGVIPGAISDEQLFLPIQPGFNRYDSHSFEYIQGKAESLNPESSTVDIVQNDGKRSSLSYTYLVIATGSKLRHNLPFKAIGSHKETLEALHNLQGKIKAAQSIVIAGGGPTGVETAGEIAAAYGSKKKITLVVGGDHVLQASKVLPGVSQSVEKDLRKLGVELVHKAKVEEEFVQAEGKIGTKVRLSNGDTITADLYMLLIGGQVNNEFIPQTLLDADGNLNLDKTMRVKGTDNIYGIGDIGNLEVKQLTVTDAQIIYLADTLDKVLTGQSSEVKEYKPSAKLMVFIALGKKYGAGQIGGWSLTGLFSWLVTYVKGRYLFVDTAPDYVNGKKLRHASM